MEIYSSPPTHQTPCTYQLHLVNELGNAGSEVSYCADTGANAIPVTNFTGEVTHKEDGTVDISFVQQENGATGRFRLLIEGICM